MEPIPPETALQQEFMRGIARRTPHIWITYVLMALCVLVYGAMVLTGVDPLNPGVQALAQWGGNAGVITFGQEQLWRLLTSVFVHAGAIHLLMNMVVLWRIGPFVERLCGNFRFLLHPAGAILRKSGQS